MARWRRRRGPRPVPWISAEQRKHLRSIMGWLTAAFFTILFALQFGLLAKMGDTRIALALVGTVVSAVWLVPHIAIALIAWRYDGEIAFGPLGRHSGGAKRATVALIFTVEAILLPLAVVLGYGRWD